MRHHFLYFFTFSDKTDPGTYFMTLSNLLPVTKNHTPIVSDTDLQKFLFEYYLFLLFNQLLMNMLASNFLYFNSKSSSFSFYAYVYCYSWVFKKKTHNSIIFYEIIKL